MAKKSRELLPKRLNKPLPPDAEEQLNLHLQKVMELLGNDTPISESDYDKLRVIADTLKPQCDDLFDIVVANPEFLQPEPGSEHLTVQDIRNDKLYYEFCDKFPGAVAAMMLRMKREQIIAGAQYENALGIYAENVERAANRGTNQKAKLVLEQIMKLKKAPSSGGSSPKPQPAPSAPPATPAPQQ